MCERHSLHEVWRDSSNLIWVASKLLPKNKYHNCRSCGNPGSQTQATFMFGCGLSCVLNGTMQFKGHLAVNTQRFHFQGHTRAGKGVCRLQNSENRTLYVEWVRRQTRVPHYSSGPSSSTLTIEPGALLQPYLETPFPGTRKAEVRLKQLNSAPLGWATSPACKDLGNISLLLVWP